MTNHKLNNGFSFLFNDVLSPDEDFPPSLRKERREERRGEEGKKEGKEVR